MTEVFVPYGRQSISNADIEAVCRVLRSDYLTQGSSVPAFEDALAEKVNAKHAVAVNSATSALHLACLALGLQEGDTAWTVPTTFVASANCAVYCGADIDFVDISRESNLICIESLRKRLEDAKSKSKLPKVLIPVHLAGNSCDMKAIKELSIQYGFAVIEDASHAIGGRYRGEMIGACTFSDITVFSFHPVKIITTGEGGMACTNNSDIAERIKRLRSHGITKEIARFKANKPNPWVYEQHELGFNYRMTDIQGALGMSQLAQLERFVARRNELLGVYQDSLESEYIHMNRISDECLSSVHLAIAKMPTSTPDRYEQIFKYLRSKHIGVQLHYMPVHLQPYYRKKGFSEGDFPEAERYAYQSLSLPMYPSLEDTAQSRVIREVKKAVDRYLKP